MSSRATLPALGDYLLVGLQALEAPFLEACFLQDRERLLKAGDSEVMLAERRMSLPKLFVGGCEGSALVEPLSQLNRLLGKVQRFAVLALHVAKLTEA